MQRSMVDGLAMGVGGDPDGPSVVLVHGAMDRGSAFLKVTRRLGDLRWTIYDRRGYGRSETAHPADVDQHVRDLLHVVGDGPATVVGHSLGGVLALAAAARATGGAVRSVLTFEAPLPWLGWWPRRGGDDQTAIEDDPPDVAAERFMRRVVGDATWEGLPERTRRQRRLEGRALVSEMRSLREGAPFEPAAVACPVVVAVGADADEVRQRAAATLVAELPDAEQLEVPGVPHGAHLADPAAFAELVRVAVARARP